MNKNDAGTRAKKIAEAASKLAMRMGAESLIVMVGLPDGKEHSAYYVVQEGRCLLVRGLLEQGSDKVRAWLKDTYEDVP